MTREEAIEKLIDQQANDDTESAHSRADEVLCELLVSIGYADVVKEWERVDKWYA